MPQMKIDIPLPVKADADGREIALAVIEEIVERTQNRRLNKDGKRFKAYSEAYRQSLDFKLAGKNKNKVNLTLTGDMLAALDVLEVKRDKTTIGYDEGSEENDKAEGNIRGTYGDESRTPKPRNFLGISDKALAAIIAEHSDLTQYRALEFVRKNYDNKQSERL
jgi:hypothetical protein